jgi:outer membrane immunogenic protein
MKKLLLSATALVALTATASAADLPSRRAPAPVVAVAPLFTWTGFYVGAQAGYAWGEDETRVLENGIDTTADYIVGGSDFDTDGFVGGVHAGYNVQFGSFVVGVEGDIEAAGIEGDRTFADAPQLGATFTSSSEITFQGSLRARLGVAFDRVLVYGTAGLAFANFENTYTTTIPGFGSEISKFDDVQWGWTLGAGVEYAITNNLTARLEYRYTQFDSFDNTVEPGFGFEQDTDFHTVRAGVSYKFGTY